MMRQHTILRHSKNNLSHCRTSCSIGLLLHTLSGAELHYRQNGRHYSRSMLLKDHCTAVFDLGRMQELA